MGVGPRTSVVEPLQLNSDLHSGGERIGRRGRQPSADSGPTAATYRFEQANLSPRGNRPMRHIQGAEDTRRTFRGRLRILQRGRRFLGIVHGRDIDRDAVAEILAAVKGRRAAVQRLAPRSHAGRYRRPVFLFFFFLGNSRPLPKARAPHVAPNRRRRSN